MLGYLDELESEIPAEVETYLNASRILHGFIERKCQVAIECAVDANNLLIYQTTRLLIDYGKRYITNITSYLERL